MKKEEIEPWDNRGLEAGVHPDVEGRGRQTLAWANSKAKLMAGELEEMKTKSSDSKPQGRKWKEMDLETGFSILILSESQGTNSVVGNGQCKPCRELDFVLPSQIWCCFPDPLGLPFWEVVSVLGSSRWSYYLFSEALWKLQRCSWILLKLLL